MPDGRTLTRGAFVRRILPIALLVLAALALLRPYFSPTSRTASPLHPSRIQKTYTDAEADTIWRGMLQPWKIVRVIDMPSPGRLVILADVNDDGVIDVSDTAARSRGAREIVRVNDAIANGRSRVYDRSPLLDDDLQLLTIQLPQLSDESDVLVVRSNLRPQDSLAVYKDDKMSGEALLRGDARIGDLPHRDRDERRVFVWIRLNAPIVNDAECAVTVTLQRDGKTLTEDTLNILPVGGLGDPNYFSAALDYLVEPDRITGKPAKLFLDEARCESIVNDGSYETFQIVVVRHALTEMNVLETYYANNDRVRGRIKNIFEAIDRNPDEDIFINGNFFLLEHGADNHGKRALGALVHSHELSKASGPHRWQVSYQDAGIGTTPDWQFKSYCLTQREHKPGQIELIEEPLSAEGPFVPASTEGSNQKYPYMALGGLHQVHNFVHNPGFPKACMGIVDSPPQPGAEHLTGRRLIWLAATNGDRSTSRYGGEAFRHKLRDSGLVIEEGDPENGVAPGRCDLVYFDSANSVALSYKIDGTFETPTVGGRHLPGANNTFCNNYLMLSVTDNLDPPGCVATNPAAEP
ncbi:MAG: hypothetical protein HUU46_03370 [Candidatus Hydrogenedentes bacterium]|nr:hypothetical protein [Candidatus Hydrogenedentota bacterium]